jgi:hypothetical protein
MEENTPHAPKILTMLITNEDIEAAFRIFYNRSPLENEDIKQYIGITASELLMKLFVSPEFLRRPGIENLVLNATQKIQKMNPQVKPT